MEIVICRCDEKKRVQVEFVVPFSAGGGRLLQVEYGFLRVELGLEGPGGVCEAISAVKGCSFLYVK